MKLKDAYRRKNETIHVRESLLDEIRTAEVNAERVERQQKAKRRPWLIALPTAAAAVAVAGLAVFIGVKAGKTDRSTPKTANSVVAEASVEENGENFVVTNSVTTAALGTDETFEAEPASAKSTVPETVGSYEELAEIMKARTNRGGYYGGWATDGFAVEEAVPAEVEMPAAEPAAMPNDTNGMKGDSAIRTEAGTDGVAYSGTNNQVVGVDEADIVKTDGTWIYALSQANGKVYILTAEGKDSKVVGTIKMKDTPEDATYWRYYQEMILANDRLYLLGSYNDWSKQNDGVSGQYSFAEVYDISDRTAPKEISTLKQQGNYKTARLVDDMLVIVSDYRIWYLYAIDEEPVAYCPRVVVNDAEIPLVPDQIFVNPDSNENGFTVVTTINAKDGTEFDSYKAVLGGCDNVYCNGTDLLISSQEWTSEQSDEQTDASGKHFVKITSGTSTNLFRFTITDGKIEAAASTKIDGQLLNQFSMDAYNGYYRFVVTRNDSEQTIWTDGIDTYEWSSSSDCELYVLDGELNVAGRLTNLAKDEMVQSVRFMGDTAYFVTFRQVDPLFTVDLSDPQNPTVVSTLKIPGFSAYLHPFGEGKLLGIGYDADEEHGWTENVKLSMFDISDPSNVTEAFKLSVKDAHYTSVQYNHKVVFVDVTSGTVAFPSDDKYLVFRADENGFTKIGEIKIDEQYWFGDARGLFVDNAFYVVAEKEVVILSFDTMEKLGSIKLK